MENLCFIDRSLQFSKLPHKSLGNPISPSSLSVLLLFGFLLPLAAASIPLSLSPFPLHPARHRGAQEAGGALERGRLAGRVRKAAARRESERGSGGVGSACAGGGGWADCSGGAREPSGWLQARRWTRLGTAEAGGALGLPSPSGGRAGSEARERHSAAQTRRAAGGAGGASGRRHGRGAGARRGSRRRCAVRAGAGAGAAGAGARAAQARARASGRRRAAGGGAHVQVELRARHGGVRAEGGQLRHTGGAGQGRTRLGRA
jgi:hypothetical protein